MNQELLNNDNKYHKITTSEVISFKKYLPNIKQSLLIVKKLFFGKTKNYIYVVNSRSICSLELTFQKKHFMHLCGVQYVKGATGFVKDLQSGKLKLENLYIKEDGSTFQKLDVIDKLYLLNNLETKVSIGNSIAEIHYENLLRTKEDILGIAIDTDRNKVNFPLSLLNISKKDAYTLTSFDVVAIIEENCNTHVKKCLCKQKDCPSKVNNYIDNLLKNNLKSH